MKRRIFLALLLSVALSGVMRPRAQTQTSAQTQPNAQPQQTSAQQPIPPDRISLEEFRALRAADKIFVLDVRVGVTTKIKGAAYIPIDQLESHLSELPHDREIITYCSWPQEHTSARAAQTLRDKGFKARALLGGFSAWTAAGGETEPIDKTTNAMPRPSDDTQQQQQQKQVIASPNPTVDDSKTPADVGPKKVEATPIQPAQGSTQAPMKASKKKRSKHRQTKPDGD
jgi:rhodanese-related sulfurtransferase